MSRAERNQAIAIIIFAVVLCITLLSLVVVSDDMHDMRSEVTEIRQVLQLEATR